MPLASCATADSVSTVSEDIDAKKDGVLVIIEARVKPDHLEELKTYVVDRLPEARAFPGCIEVDVYFDTQDPTRLWTVGYWESIQANKNYMTWRGETGVKQVIFDMLAEPITISYFDKMDE
jgi:quinol monooxygenase YgiN